MNKKLTQEKLKMQIDYNPATGIFLWKISKYGQTKKGSEAGHYRKDGYHQLTIYGKQYQSHRLAWLYMYGYFPEHQIDHIDRNRSNNKIDNLREVTAICNMRNKNCYSNNKSGVTGVCFRNDINKWTSYIRVNKILIHQGVFINIIGAVKARWEAEKKYNFPNCNTTSSAYEYLKKHNLIDTNKKREES